MKGEPMKIETLVLGNLQTNCYILTQNNTAIVIDPVENYQNIMKKVGEKQLLSVLITHYHPDHIGALQEFLQRKIPIIDYTSKEKNHTIGPFTFELIKTKGHTPDSITYYFPKDQIMFTGDFLFYHTIGRTDMQGGNIEEMNQSLSKIKTYPENTTIYPGHGIKTTLKEELKSNPYF